MLGNKLKKSLPEQGFVHAWIASSSVTWNFYKDKAGPNGEWGDNMHKNIRENQTGHNNEDILDCRLGYEISHSLRGRLRVRIPSLTHSKELTLAERDYLSKIKGVQQVSSNYSCGSITIHYDHRIITEKEILEVIGSTEIKELTDVRTQFLTSKNGFLETKLSRLGWSTITVVLTIIFADTLFPVRILLYIMIILISFPIYQQAYQTIVKDRRIDLDALNAFAMTIGILADDLVVTAIMAQLIYLGDYANELIASGSSKTLRMLMGEGPENKEQNRNNRSVRLMTGLATLAVGIALLPLPGPGIVVIPIGLGMLAKEYTWAKKFDGWFKKVKAPVI